MRDFAAIQCLVDNTVPESEILVYKRHCYGHKDGDKRELPKNISSFTHSRGGYIVIGIDEKQGVPTKISE